MTNRIQKNLWTIVLVFVIIVFLIYFIGGSCLAGYCSVNPNKCNKKIEGYQDPVDIDHIGNYFMIASVGEGPRYQANRGFGGAGTYAFAPNSSGYTGVYGDSRNASEKGPDLDCLKGGGPPEFSSQRTPHTWSWAGRYNQSKCPCGYGSCRCCNQDGRGCKVRFDQYSYFPARRALPP